MSARPSTGIQRQSRLSQVLAAGLERKGSLQVCPPCRSVAQWRRTAATDVLLDYESEAQLRDEAQRAGIRPLVEKQCPEDDDDCDAEKEGVPYDAISFDEFKPANPQTGRRATEVMLLGCGHSFQLSTVQNHNRDRPVPFCPRMREHGGTADGNYRLTPAEITEIGWVAPVQSDDEEDEEVDAAFQEEYFIFRFQDAENPVQRTFGPNGEVLSVQYMSKTTYYEGPRGEEHRVRTESNATQGDYLFVAFFEGPRGADRMTHKEVRQYPGMELLSTTFYEGEKDDERMVRREQTTTVEYFEGGADEELVVREDVYRAGGVNNPAMLRTRKLYEPDQLDGEMYMYKQMTYLGLDTMLAAKYYSADGDHGLVKQQVYGPIGTITHTITYDGEIENDDDAKVIEIELEDGDAYGVC